MDDSFLVAVLVAPLATMPLAYWLVWFGSLGLSIALVALLRSRWGQSRPLHKCAVLSLLVHLMLAWAAMTVRIVAGSGDGSDDVGPAIRVRVVEDALEGPALAAIPTEMPLASAPPLLEVPVEQIQSPAEQLQAKTASDESPTANPAESEPVTTEPDVLTEVQVPDDTARIPELSDVEADTAAAGPAEKQAAREPDPASTASAAQPATESTSPTTAEHSSVVTTPTSVASTANTPYSLRDAPGRLGLVEQEGGSGQTEAAVDAALRWLATAQSRDGRWDSDEFGAGQEQMVLGHNRGGAGRNADTGISALAVLAFLGAGHSHQHGDYQDTVRRGLDFLLRSQAADGNLFGDATLYAQMYCHSMATFALAEAQAMSGDRRLEPAVMKAVNFCLSAQNASTGGWRYRPGDPGDTSQLGWQIMALASAERAGVRVPQHAWMGIDRFLRSVARGTYGGLASYRPDSPASTSMTAEALYCRLLLAETLGATLPESAAHEATTQLLTALPSAERINLYYWYYATLALHHRHQQNEYATAAWKAWNEAICVALVTTQVADGQNAGSWDTDTVWGGYGGRVYTTAMAAMCLEVYYRYAPVRTNHWTATRSDTQQAPR